MSTSDRIGTVFGQTVQDAQMQQSANPQGAIDGATGRRRSDQPGARSKYHREIKPGVFVDVYDVLAAWKVDNPALQHLIKKALQPGERGHKTRQQDLCDIVSSALRAKELG